MRLWGQPDRLLPGGGPPLLSQGPTSLDAEHLLQLRLDILTDSDAFPRDSSGLESISKTLFHELRIDSRPMEPDELLLQDFPNQGTQTIQGRL